MLQKTSLLGRVLLGIALLATLPALALDVGAAEKKVLEDIQKRDGQLLPENENPALYKYLRNMTDRLAEAQKQIAVGENRFVSESHLYIVKNENPIAFVSPLQTQGLHSQQNIIVASTGLLKIIQSCAQFTAEKAGGGTRATQVWAVILGNIFGHELAHPKLHQDFELSDNKTSQSEEILADKMGMGIAKQAGYSSQGLLVGLRCIYAYKRGLKSKEEGSAALRALGAKFSTHPQDVLRETHLRAVLALRKMLEAQTSNWDAEAVSPALVAEMTKLMNTRATTKTKKEEEITKPEDADLEKILGYFDSQKYGSFVGYQKQIELNLWLLRLDYHLTQTTTPISATNLERAFNAIYNLSNSRSAIVDYGDLRLKDFSTQERSLILPGMRDAGYSENYFHTDYVYTSPIFRSQAWVNLVKAKFEGEYDAFKSAQYFLPPTLVDELYGKQIDDQIAKGLPQSLRGGSVANELTWSWFLHNRYATHDVSLLRTYSITGYVQSLRSRFISAGRDNKDLSYLDPLSFQIFAPDHLTYAQTETDVLNTLRELAKQDPSTYQQLKNTAALIWKNRAKYVLADLVTETNTYFGWAAIIELTGQQPATAYAELNRGFREALLTVQKAGGSFVDAKHAIPWLDQKSFSDLQNFRTLEIQMRMRLYVASPSTFRADFEKEFSGVFSPTLNIDKQVKIIYESLTRNKFEIKDAEINNLPAPIEDIIARTIWNSNLTLQEKRRHLDQRYLKDGGLAFGSERRKDVPESNRHWAAQTFNGANLTVLTILKQAGLTDSILQLFQAWNSNTNSSVPRTDNRYLWMNGKQFASAVKGMQAEILKEIDNIKNVASPSDRGNAILNASKVLLAFDSYKDYGIEVSWDEEIFREIRRRLAKLATQTDLPLPKRIAIFEALTKTGVILETDQYFKSVILPDFKQLDSDGYKTMKRMLTDRRFASQTIAVEITQRLTTAEATSLANKATDGKIIRLLEGIQRMLPFDSPKKDELLEFLSWRAKLQDDRYLLLMRDYKSVNWRRLNPQLVEWASFISENLSDLTRAEIKDLIYYLADPHNRLFPSSIDRAMMKATDREVRRFLSNQGQGDKVDPQTVAQLQAEALARIRESLIRRAKDSSPTDRVPIFALLLHSGAKPYAADPDFVELVITEIMGLDTKSGEAIAIRSWIETIPPADEEFEKTMSLAYELSTLGAEKSSIRAGFEMFGTVGKKTGQAASIFQIEAFSHDTLEELAELKDSKRGLDMYDIKKRIEQKLGHDRFKLIDLLGAASIKTVALIQLENGEYRAANLLNEGARETLQMHIERGKAFVRRLAANGLPADLELFNAYIQALEQGLPEELDLRNEVSKYKEMADFFEKMNRSFSAAFPNMRFAVPQVDLSAPHDSDFYLTTYAPGVAYDEVKDADLKTRSGEMIFQALIRGLLLHGKFESDRHHKNIKIEARTNEAIIWMLDPGQFQSFKTSSLPFVLDDRLIIARFLTAVSKGDVNLLVKTLASMQQAGNNVDLESLKTPIATVFQSSSSTQSRLIQIVKVLHRNHYMMDFRFDFTAFKGLMVLIKEGYVASDRAEAIIETAVKETLMRKADVTTLATHVPILSTCEGYLQRLVGQQ